MAFRVGDVLGLIWSHPIFSVGVLLLFTPPLFPIVVFFSPLLISTALFVLAMISMGSDVDETPTYSSDSSYKRVWVEENDEDGPHLENERVSKRLRASSKDETWFDKVKNWEGTGRAWVDSVISQEVRRSFGSDDNEGTREAGVPLLVSAAEEFSNEESKLEQESGFSRDTLQEPAPEDEASSGLALQQIASASDQSEAAPVESSNLNEIIPELESEAQPIEIAPKRSNLLSPLFRIRSLRKSDSSKSQVVNALRSWSMGSKDMKGSSAVKIDQAPENGDSVQNTDSEAAKTIILCDAHPSGGKELVVSAAEEPNASVDAQNTAFALENVPKSCIEASTLISSLQLESTHEAIAPDSIGEETSSVSSADASSPERILETISRDNSPERVNPVSLQEVTQPDNISEGTNPGSIPEAIIPESRSVGENGADRTPPVAEGQGTDPTASLKGQGISDALTLQSREVNSAAEALAPFRQWKASSQGTPSAAVALSEKLQVPLEDIMSLLAGDDKENALNEGAAAAKPASSSSESTTSQEEEWSSSDDESPAPLDSEAGASGQKEKENRSIIV